MINIETDVLFSVEEVAGSGGKEGLTLHVRRHESTGLIGGDNLLNLINEFRGGRGFSEQSALGRGELTFTEDEDAGLVNGDVGIDHVGNESAGNSHLILFARELGDVKEGAFLDRAVGREGHVFSVKGTDNREGIGSKVLNVHVAGVAGRAENEVARSDRGDLGAEVLEDVAAVAGERERGGVVKGDARSFLVLHGIEVDRTDGGRLLNGEGASGFSTGNTGVTGKVETADGLGVERFALLQRQRTVGEDNLDAAIIVDEVLSGIEVGERVFEGLGRQVESTVACKEGLVAGRFIFRLGCGFSSGSFLLLEEVGGGSLERTVFELEGTGCSVLVSNRFKGEGAGVDKGGIVDDDLAGCTFTVIKVEATDGNDGLFTEIEGALLGTDGQLGEVVLAAFESDGTLLIQRADLEVAREDLAGDMHLGVVIRKALVAGDEELILRQVGVRLQVDAGVELRDVEDAAFVNGNRLEGVVVAPDGGVQTGVVKGHGFVGGLQAVFEREVGFVLQIKKRGNTVFSLDLHRVDGAVEREGRIAGCKVNETVDVGLGAEFESRIVGVVLDFDGGGAFGGGIDRAVVREVLVGDIDQHTVSPFILGLVEDFADGDRAVVDADALDISTAEFEAGTLAFNDDPAVVLDGRRFSAVFGSADEHAVGVLGDDGACVDGLSTVGGTHGVVLPGGLARHVDLAGVLDRGAVGSPETGGAGVLLNTVHPKRLVEREGLVLFGGAEEGSGGFGILRREVVGVLVKLPISRGGRRGILRSLNPFGSHRGAGNTGEHRRDRSGHDRLRALALHGGRNFIYNHQGAARLVENNLECRIHVNYSFWEEKTNAKVLLRKLRIAKFQGLVLGGGVKTLIRPN